MRCPASIKNNVTILTGMFYPHHHLLELGTGVRHVCILYWQSSYNYLVDADIYIYKMNK